MKKCRNPECKQPWKDESEYYNTKSFRRNKNGLSPRCKECMRQHHSKEDKRRRYENSPLKYRPALPPNLKRCANSKCNEWKDRSEFNSNKKAKDGLSWQCRDCEHKRGEKYYQDNKEKVFASLRKRRNTPEYILQARIRANLRRALKAKKNKKSIEYIGCSIPELKRHFEENYFNDEINWDTMDTWHIDHIIPIAVFDHSDEKEILKCWHYTNLRPLPAKENLRKGSKIPQDINFIFQ